VNGTNRNKKMKEELKSGVMEVSKQKGKKYARERKKGEGKDEKRLEGERKGIRRMKGRGR
jgi:hypothetical protein